MVYRRTTTAYRAVLRWHRVLGCAAESTVLTYGARYYHRWNAENAVSGTKQAVLTASALVPGGLYQERIGLCLSAGLLHAGGSAAVYGCSAAVYGCSDAVYGCNTAMDGERCRAAHNVGTAALYVGSAPVCGCGAAVFGLRASIYGRSAGFETLCPMPQTLDPCDPDPTPYTLHPTPYTLHPTP
eukprot:1091977-Rhodomonas_salina.2